MRKLSESQIYWLRERAGLLNEDNTEDNREPFDHDLADRKRKLMSEFIRKIYELMNHEVISPHFDNEPDSEIPKYTGFYATYYYEPSPGDGTWSGWVKERNKNIVEKYLKDLNDIKKAVNDVYSFYKSEIMGVINFDDLGYEGLDYKDVKVDVEKTFEEMNNLLSKLPADEKSAVEKGGDAMVYSTTVAKKMYDMLGSMVAALRRREKSGEFQKYEFRRESIPHSTGPDGEPRGYDTSYQRRLKGQGDQDWEQYKYETGQSKRL